jgi:hypothetical protein
MRAPHDKKPLRVPGFSRVPKYSPIERACRLAGEEPKSNAGGRFNRRRWDGRIARLFCQDDVTANDVRAVADYLRGRFDRRQKQGRPFDPWHHVASDITIEIVRQFQREHKCSLRRAIDLARPLLQLDAAAARRLWKRLTR